MLSTLINSKKSSEKSSEEMEKRNARVDGYRRYAFYFVIAATPTYSAVYFYPG